MPPERRSTYVLINKCVANLLMLEPSRHERNGHPSVVSRHFLMSSFANFKAGHGFSDEIGETSIVTRVGVKLRQI
jgi:hypothetical protein